MTAYWLDGDMESRVITFLLQQNEWIYKEQVKITWSLANYRAEHTGKLRPALNFLPAEETPQFMTSSGC
jgi:hypothetical protein